jgi:hypothetical protein
MKNHLQIAEEFWSTHFSLSKSHAAKEKFAGLFGFALLRPSPTRWWSFYEEINKTLPQFPNLAEFIQILIEKDACKKKASKLQVKQGGDELVKHLLAYSFRLSQHLPLYYGLQRICWRIIATSSWFRLHA